MTRIVCISDTHEKHAQVTLPEGDILVHAGDSTFRGEFYAVASFANWLKQQPHQHKIVIAGNHELSFQTPYRKMMLNLLLEAGVIYLEDSGMEINNLFFYGTPWQPWFHDWAFNLPRDGEELRNKWKQIPDQTNILISHGPPYGILDGVQDISRGPQGCKLLKKRVVRLPKLKAHIFGHLHHDGGQTVNLGGVQFVNAAICDDMYNPSRTPIVIEI